MSYAGFYCVSGATGSYCNDNYDCDNPLVCCSSIAGFTCSYSSGTDCTCKSGC